MVDLVKIRKKKAEKKKEEEAAAAATAPATPGSVEEPAAIEEAVRKAAPPPEPEVPAAPAPPPEPAVAASGRDDGGHAPSKLDRFKAQAGQRREFQASAQEAVAEDQVELLTFVIAGEQYAVDIERIVEIVTPRPVTRIPNADASVVGIISLRGTIVTLVDVRRKLRHAGSAAETEETRIVVIDYHNETVGFVVDRVLRVVKTAAGEIEPHPVVHATELDESVRGVFRAGGALTILLDLDKLLDHRALAATS